MKKVLFLFLLLSSFEYSFSQGSLTQEIYENKANEELADKGIEEDEVKAALLKKGIDLDNLRPDQIPTLEDEIQQVVSELSSSDKGGENEAVDDIKTTLTGGVDSLLKEKSEEILNEVIYRSGDTSIEASLEKQLANNLSEKISKVRRVKSDIYGHDIFFDKSIDLYNTTSSTSTPSTYVLDVGDKIAINIFGASQADLLYEIEEDGFIRPTGLYKIYLKGVTIDKAKILLKNRFRQGFTFTDGQFNVTLHSARTINVNVFGEVNEPGSYTISALNTALNAIIIAGGIDSQASVRNIKILSNGKERVLDVYDFLANPTAIYDYYLGNNDIIFVPKFDRVVSAKGGGFKVNGKFELTQGENFEKLLDFTQGLNSRAYKKTLTYKSFNGEERTLSNYSFDEFIDENISLQDGDIIEINNSTIEYRNFVKVSGAVRHEGEYEFIKDMRVSDILELVHLEEETFSDVSYIKRKNSDGTFKLVRVYPDKVIKDPSSEYNVILQKEDELTFFSKAQFVDNFSFNISGAVRKPNEYFYDPSDNMTIYDAIVMSEGLQANATDFGYIIGQPINNSLKRTYTVINLAEIIKNPDGPENLKIKANDKIFIPTQQAYTDQFIVKISGAVRVPGEYIYDSTLSVKDLLIMAGGLKLEAAHNKVDVYRLKIVEDEATVTYSNTFSLKRDLEPFNDDASSIKVQPHDHFVVRSNPEYEPIQYVNIIGAVKYPGVYAIMGNNDKVSALIQRSGGFTSEALPEAAIFTRQDQDIGRLVTRLDKAVEGSEKYDIILKPNDEIIIPKSIDIVKLYKLGTQADNIESNDEREGEEKLNLVLNYQKKRANWYVRHFAGGFDKKVVRRSKTVVIHPNGEIKRTLNFLLFKVYPKVRQGSEIKLRLKARVIRKRAEQNNVLDYRKYKKDKRTSSERLLQLQAFISVTTATLSSTIALIDLIQSRNEQ